MKQISTQPQKNSPHSKKNTIETLKDLGGGMAKNTANEFKKIGSGIFDQFFGGQSYDGDYTREISPFRRETKVQPRKKDEFSVFSYQQYYEREIIKKEIRQLMGQIHKEIEYLKNAGSSLISEVSDIQKQAIQSLPEKPGVYHIRFLEILLSIIRSLRAKIGESRTWLAAMTSKKKKRGSLFAVRSKKQGTLYSLSQELQTARSVQ